LPVARSPIEHRKMFRLGIVVAGPFGQFKMRLDDIGDIDQ